MSAALIAAVAIVVLIAIAWYDFCHLRIRNTAVLTLIGLYLVFALATGFEFFLSDLVAGGVLFGLGFLLWMLGLMGAGDAKLYLPVGLFAGFDGLLPYAVLVLLASGLFFAVIVIGSIILKGRFLIGRRLQEIRISRKIPYSVPMATAVSVVLCFRVSFMI